MSYYLYVGPRLGPPAGWLAGPVVLGSSPLPLCRYSSLEVGQTRSSRTRADATRPLPCASNRGMHALLEEGGVVRPRRREPKKISRDTRLVLAVAALDRLSPTTDAGAHVNLRDHLQGDHLWRVALQRRRSDCGWRAISTVSCLR